MEYLVISKFYIIFCDQSFLRDKIENFSSHQTLMVRTKVAGRASTDVATGGRIFSQ